MRPAPYHLQETGDLGDPGPRRWLPQHRHRCGAVLVQGQADGASTQYLELPFALALALIDDGEDAWSLKHFLRCVMQFSRLLVTITC
jgi:hypothetical protein